MKYWIMFSDFCDKVAKIIVVVVALALVVWLYKEYSYPYQAGKYEFYKDYYNSKNK